VSSITPKRSAKEKGKARTQGKPPSRIDGLMAASLTYILWFGLKKIEL
jgi:hypothetical protein